jgi:hypothetical protein
VASITPCPYRDHISGLAVYGIHNIVLYEG